MAPFASNWALSSSQIRSLDLHQGLTCAAAGGRGHCGIYDLDGKERVKFIRHTPLLINLVNGALSHSNQLAVTAGQGDEVFLWRTSDGGVLRRLGGQGRTGWSVAWSLDGQTVAWGNTRKRTGTLTIRNRPLEHTFSVAELQVGGAAPDTYRRALDSLGEMVVEQGDGKGVKIKQGTTTLATFKILRVRCATLLAGDRAVIGGSGLALFEARTGKKLREFRGANEVYAVAPSPDGRYLLTASDNQALSVWTLDRDDPLLSLFVAGREWIAWTPEGYYAASPGGERLMGWHVNNGPDQLATVHPAARFRSSLYRPDVIKRLLPRQQHHPRPSDGRQVARADDATGAGRRGAAADRGGYRARPGRRHGQRAEPGGPGHRPGRGQPPYHRPALAARWTALRRR